MKHLSGGVATLALVAGAASADGITRADIPSSIMFEKGNYVQLSFGHVTPGISGGFTAPLSAAGGASSTGNMAQNYSNVGLALKMDVSENLSFGLFFGQPYGAQASYEQGFYNGLSADWASEQLSAVAKYRINNNFSVYSGLRYVTSQADITIPDQLIRPAVNGAANNGVAAASAALAVLPAGDRRIPVVEAQLAQATALAAASDPAGGLPAGTFGYAAQGNRDSQFGYLLGAAYERPEIALRVALTYESGVLHEFETHESLPGLGFGGTTTTKVEMPQSLRLDFQSGVAADILVFGSIEWTEWSVWEIAPPQYEAAFNQNVTSFDNDTWRHQLGVGRKFSDSFSGFARVTHESAKGGEASRLSPTDGSTALGLGGTWTRGDAKLTTGVEYVMLGDAKDGSDTDFSDNTALGFGMSLGFKF